MSRHQKLLKKWQGQQNYFFRQFFGFLVFSWLMPNHFWTQNGSPGPTFWCFLRKAITLWFHTICLTTFCNEMLRKLMEMKKHDSLKIVVFPRKNNDFQGLLLIWNHHVCFLICVFLMKKKRCKNDEKTLFSDQKINPKRWRPQIRRKTSPDTLPDTTFWATNAFFVLFCSPAARGWASEMTSGRCAGGVREVSGRWPGRFKGFTDLRRLSKSARLASRWLQRGPRTPPGNSPGRFCDGFSIHFLLQFAMKISGKKLENIKKKCDSD